MGKNRAGLRTEEPVCKSVLMLFSFPVSQTVELHEFIYWLAAYSHILFSFVFTLLLQPLLIQCRLFHNGSASKGTLLVNKKVWNPTFYFETTLPGVLHCFSCLYIFYFIIVYLDYNFIAKVN